VAPAGAPRSEIARIVERIPSEFFAAFFAAVLAAVAFALVWLRERRRSHRARRDALVDPLTGIPNRLAFYERLSHEWGRARRYQRDLGVILLDMDGLKQINDGDGHAAGDRALTTIAETISADIRQSDLAARLAGDEFVVLCPETGEEGLERLGDKLRQKLDSQGVGMSVGVAAFEQDDRSPEDLLERADHAMYDDKAARRSPRRRRVRGQPALAKSGSAALRAS